MYVFKCISVSLIVIGVIFSQTPQKYGGSLHVSQFDLQKLDWCIERGSLKGPAYRSIWESDLMSTVVRIDICIQYVGGI